MKQELYTRSYPLSSIGGELAHSKAPSPHQDAGKFSRQHEAFKGVWGCTETCSDSIHSRSVITQKKCVPFGLAQQSTVLTRTRIFKVAEVNTPAAVDTEVVEGAEGKVFVVTGASSGIGYAAALMAALAGARVVAVARSADKLHVAAEELRAAGAENVVEVGADVSTEGGNERAIAAALHHYGRVDRYFANAGAFTTTSLAECDKGVVDSIVDTNFKGVVYGLKHALRAMKECGGGSIVVTSSSMSLVAKSGAAGVGLYSATKAAVDTMVRYAAIEGAPHGIRVNSIQPGLVATKILGPDVPSEAFDAAAANTHLVSRAGRPNEIASLAMFLLSDKASFITGSCHLCDGGWSITAK